MSDKNQDNDQRYSQRVRDILKSQPMNGLTKDMVKDSDSPRAEINVKKLGSEAYVAD